MTGKVYLVGAGPGVPGLLTLRALELLQMADVVAHDLLVPESILALADPRAERLPVGRLAGFPKPEHRLHPEVLARARAGRQVVRLKGGDPMVFGRGAEEAEELAAAGIPFEIVPGVSAALAAASCAGIPLTDRRAASGVILATGHQLEGADAARGATVVLYMVRKKLGQNVRRLVAAGWSPETPAALVAGAARPGQQVVAGTLADIEERVASSELSGPSLLIAGDVVRLRERIAWFERLPLAGRQVLVARSRPGPSRLARLLREQGAAVTELPRIDVAPLDSFEVPEDLGAWDVLLFGCSAGVEAFLERLGAAGRDVRDLPRMPWYAAGQQATAALRAAGLHPGVALPGSCAGAVQGAADALQGASLLLVCADRGRPALQAELERVGAQIDLLPAYRVIEQWPPGPGRFDLVVLPSSSAARAVYGRLSLADTPAVAIGPRSAEAARELGAAQLRVAPTDSFEALLDLVQETWR